METPLEREYDLRDIKIEDIDFGDRVREEMGDLMSLANDIKEHGVISPILVVNKEKISGTIEGHSNLDPEKPFLLVAGERRTRASQRAGLERIPAKVFERTLSEYEARTMELHENILRKQMTPWEEARAKEELHTLYQKMKGKPLDAHSGGHTQQDTADLLGESKGTVSMDLKIARWGRDVKEVREAESKAEARKIIRKKKKEIAAKEKARRVKEEQKQQEETGEVEIEGAGGEVTKLKKSLTDRYKIGDYFNLINQLPDGCIDLLELDPDWGIDFIQKRSERNQYDTDSSYKSVPPDAYEQTLRDILRAAWPKLKDHSWVILWYSIEEWHKETGDILADEGFKVQRMPAFWIKEAGNTATPAYRLGESVGAFYYARKGNPRITEEKMGRNNSFSFRNLRQSERVHPAEKPVELYEEILKTFGNRGQVVVSGFAGSGNILLAAENLQMNSVGFEMSDEWKDDFAVRVFNHDPGEYHSYGTDKEKAPEVSRESVLEQLDVDTE